MLRSDAASLPLAVLLVALGPLAATWRVASARSAAATGRGRASPGETARRTSLLMVMPPCLLGAALALLPPHARAPSGSSSTPAVSIGIAILVLAFPLLVGERILDAQARDAQARNAQAADAQAADPLPEARNLRRLALSATLLTFAIGSIEIALTLGVSLAPLLMRAVAGVAALIGVELGLRAIGRCFLPPGPPEAARAVTDSLLARLLLGLLRLDREQAGSPAQLLRDQLGIDVSRSWAMSYLRAVAWPLTLVLLLAAWGLSSVVIVPVQRRAVSLRFGAPVAVLRPGLHLILPWPLGIARPVEWGAVHELALGDAPSAARVAAPPAEDPAPTEADRLWDRPHPGELTLLVASMAAPGAARERRATQLFQSVAVDIRVFYRIGLDDRAAIEATTAMIDPGRLLRADAARIVGAAFAARTLPQVLGADSARLGAELRDRLQDLLRTQRAGLEPVAVIIEAIHPPAGAAEAYHAVRAAIITADAAIYAERGRAMTVRAQTRQYAFAQAAAADARAAEVVGAARSGLIGFTADEAAYRADGASFLLERRLAALHLSLARTPMTIIDQNLAAPGATTLDLRPAAGAAASTGDGE